MPAAPLPPLEAARLAALHGLALLDAPADRDLDDLVTLAAQLAHCPIALVSLVDTDRQVFTARHGLSLPMTGTPRSQAFCAHAILTPQDQLVVRDARLDPRFADNPMVLGPPGIRAYLGTPLVTPDGAAIGTLCVLDVVPRDFLPEERAALLGLGATAMAMLARRRPAGGPVQTDGLTGLASRAALLTAVQGAARRLAERGQRFGLLSIGLDGVDALRASDGAAVGDAVLRAAAGVLAATTRKEELAARLQDDRFAVLLVCGRGHARGAAERLRETLAGRMAAEGWAVSAAVGAVTFAGPPDDPAAGLALADAMLAAARADGLQGVSHRFHDGSAGGLVDPGAP